MIVLDQEVEEETDQEDNKDKDQEEETDLEVWGGGCPGGNYESCMAQYNNPLNCHRACGGM